MEPIECPCGMMLEAEDIDGNTIHCPKCARIDDICPWCHDRLPDIDDEGILACFECFEVIKADKYRQEEETREAYEDWLYDCHRDAELDD